MDISDKTNFTLELHKNEAALSALGGVILRDTPKIIL